MTATGRRVLAVVLALLVVALVVVLLSSHGRPAPQQPAVVHPLAAAGFDAADVTCASPGEPGHLPTSIGEITVAYTCSSEQQAVPGDGIWSVDVVRRYTTDLGRLQQALAAPDERRGGGACEAYADLPMPIWVVGSGWAVVRPRYDTCGHYAGDVPELLAELPSTVLSTTRTQRLESATAAKSGCADEYKDMLRIEVADGAGQVGVPGPMATGRRWTVCRYGVTADSGGTPSGLLESATRLTKTQVDEVAAALAASAPDGSCRRDAHRRFAVLQSDGRSYVVALDGCAVQDADGTWARATDRLRALLAS